MTDVRRIAFLFTRLSGYMAACLRAVQARHGVDLLVVRQPPAAEAPFETAQFDWIDALHDRSTLSERDMEERLSAFDPQAVYLGGWSDRGYLRVARRFRPRGAAVVVGCDTQWTGTLRQQAGRVLAPWLLHAAADVMWVPGERQRLMAEKLGFTGPRCWVGGDYACDWETFASIYGRVGTDRPRAFLYAGRYVDVKGIDVLMDAYAAYRVRVAEPWPLHCAGTGPLRSLLEGREGVVDHGFAQPVRLAELMGAASAFVLPSRREPWGVVVNEAAATGLPLLCSDASGAAVHLLQDGYNGYLFEAGNAAHLAAGMIRMTEAPRETWEAMCRRSYELSKQFTPARWADTLVEGAARLRAATDR